MKPLYVWKFQNDMSLTFVDIIEQYDTLMWTKRFYTAGEFELYNYEPKLLRYVGNNHAISRDNLGTDIMFIEKGIVTTDENGKPQYKISGRDLLSILDRRVKSRKAISPSSGYPPRYFIKISFQDVFTNSSDTDRRIVKLSNDISAPFGDSIDISISPDSLFNIYTRLCEDNGFGQKMTRYSSSGNIVYSLYDGAEKPVTFKRDFENLLTTEYTKDTTNSFNVGYVTDSNGYVHDVYGSQDHPAGINRIEKIVSSECSRDDFSTDGEFIGALYRDAIHQMYLSDDDAMQCEVEPNSTFKFGTDYKLGDIVTVEEMNMKAKVRVVEAIWSFDNSGDRLVLTLETQEVIA